MSSTTFFEPRCLEPNNLNTRTISFDKAPTNELYRYLFGVDLNLNLNLNLSRYKMMKLTVLLAALAVANASNPGTYNPTRRFPAHLHNADSHAHRRRPFQLPTGRL